MGTDVAAAVRAGARHTYPSAVGLVFYLFRPAALFRGVHDRASDVRGGIQPGASGPDACDLSDRRLGQSTHLGMGGGPISDSNPDTRGAWVGNGARGRACRAIQPDLVDR